MKWCCRSLSKGISILAGSLPQPDSGFCRTRCALTRRFTPYPGSILSSRHASKALPPRTSQTTPCHGFCIGFTPGMRKSASRMLLNLMTCWHHCSYARSGTFGGATCFTAKTDLPFLPSANRVASQEESRQNCSVCSTSRFSGWVRSISPTKEVSVASTPLDELSH